MVVFELVLYCIASSKERNAIQHEHPKLCATLQHEKSPFLDGFSAQVPSVLYSLL